MHIPPGILDPTLCVVSGAAATGLLGYALRRTRRDYPEHIVPLMGLTAACLFAAQMINFPIPFLGISGHILGCVLVTALVGPWPGFVVVSVVLAVQSLMFQDGGIDALGANILNLAGAGCLIGHCILTVIKRWIPGRAGAVAGSVLAAWLTTQVAALGCGLELAWGRSISLEAVLGALLIAHSAIGVFEAFVTGLILSSILRLRPELLYQPHCTRTNLAGIGQWSVTGLALAVLGGVLLAPWASLLPDGLEGALTQFRIISSGEFLAAPMPGYASNAFGSIGLATSFAAFLGTLIVFVFALAIGWILHLKTLREISDVP